jgi:hypothetical protein
MRARVNDAIPRFGWDQRTLYASADSLITDADLDLDPVERLPGLFEVAVSAVMTNQGGAGTVDLILEGSNTGNPANPAEWFPISSLGDDQLFDVSFVVPTPRILGLTPLQGGNGQLGVGRFNFLRVRAEIVSGAPTFDLNVNMTGIAGDGQKINKGLTARSESGAPNEIVTDSIRRPAGTRWLTPTAILRSVVLDPLAATGFDVSVEAALSEEDALAGNFTGFATGSSNPLVAVGDATLMDSGISVPAIDMGPYNFFRLRVRNDTGTPPTDLSSYTIEGNFLFDDNDWQDGETGLTNLATTILRKGLIAVWEDSSLSGPFASPLTLNGQFLDENGQPFRSGPFAPRRAIVVVSDTQRGKELTLHPSATASGDEAAGQGTTPATQYVVEADQDGRFSIDVQSGGGPTTAYISFRNYVDDPGPQYANYRLVSSDVATVTFV